LKIKSPSGDAVKQGVAREQLPLHGHESAFAGQLHGASGKMVFTRPTIGQQ